jgi:hypothetical protein
MVQWRTQVNLAHTWLKENLSLTEVFSTCRNATCTDAFIIYPAFTNTANDITSESVTHNLIVNEHIEVFVLRGSRRSREIFLDSLTSEEGTDWLSRNVGN